MDMPNPQRRFRTFRFKSTHKMRQKNTWTKIAGTHALIFDAPASILQRDVSATTCVFQMSGKYFQKRSTYLFRPNQVLASHQGSLLTIFSHSWYLEIVGWKVIIKDQTYHGPYLSRHDKMARKVAVGSFRATLLSQFSSFFAGLFFEFD